VIATPNGGGFGGKSDPFNHEMVIARAALLLDRPVKICLTREEVFYCHRGRHPVLMTFKTGVKMDGTITGMHVKTLLDGGAYGSYGVASTFYTGALQTVTYHIPTYHFEGCRVFTNKPPCGPKRGHGTPQPRFGQEVQLDKIAELAVGGVTVLAGSAARRVAELLETCIERSGDLAEYARLLGVQRGESQALAGLATKQIATALLGKEDAKQSEIEAATANASPETLVKLKELDQAFQVKMGELGIELEKLDTEDRANARAREIAVRDWVPQALAMGIAAAFLVLLFWMFTGTLPPENKDAFNILLGLLGGSMASVMSYYFGSSRGSSHKDTTISDALKRKF
jgi:hypothetical protein